VKCREKTLGRGVCVCLNIERQSQGQTQEVRPVEKTRGIYLKEKRVEGTIAKKGGIPLKREHPRGLSMERSWGIKRFR